MNVFGKFDEIQSLILQDIKETKRFGHTFVRTDGQTDNVKTVYPPTNTVCGGIINAIRHAYEFILRTSMLNIEHKIHAPWSKFTMFPKADSFLKKAL